MLQPASSIPGCTPAARVLYPRARQWRMAQKKQRRATFLRQWRIHRHMTLEQVAERVPMDKGNLSKVERGILQYNQEMLERLADIYMTDVASLLMRDPSQPEAIWSLWDRAKPGTRRQIESVAEAILRTGTDN